MVLERKRKKKHEVDKNMKVDNRKTDLLREIIREITFDDHYLNKQKTDFKKSRS